MYLDDHRYTVNYKKFDFFCQRQKYRQRNFSRRAPDLEKVERLSTRTVPGVVIDRGSFFDDRIHIGYSHEDPDTVSVHGSRDRITTFTIVVFSVVSFKEIW
jgi:hypothetical protein